MDSFLLLEPVPRTFVAAQAAAQTYAFLGDQDAANQIQVDWEKAIGRPSPLAFPPKPPPGVTYVESPEEYFGSPPQENTLQAAGKKKKKKKQKRRTGNYKEF